MTLTSREIEKLFDEYNPNSIKAGDRVMVQLCSQQYIARIVGLDLDIKNKKVYASLKILHNDNHRSRPSRVDVTDCALLTSQNTILYPGHHPQERE